MGSSVQLRYQGGYTSQHALKVEERPTVVMSLCVIVLEMFLHLSEALHGFKLVEKHRLLRRFSTLWFLFLFSFPGTQFEGGSVDVYTMVENIKYPQDPHTRTISAAVHPELQVWQII